MSEKGLRELSKQGVIGSNQISSLEFCEKCVFSKATRQKFGTSKQETKHSMDYIHSDLWGPSQVPSHGGARYFMTLIGDYTRKVWVYVLKQKGEALLKFKEWMTLIENQTERKVKRLRIDNGLEYYSKEFDSFCKEKGIVRHKTVRRIPQQNGLAERMNRTLVEKVRCMLFSANLSKHFWADAVTTAAYLINRSPSTALNFKTPQEVWSGKIPDLSNLRIFSSPTYAHIKQGKLESRAIKGIFIGYPEGVKEYRIWFSDGKPSRVIVSRDVIFYEDAMLQQKVETELLALEQSISQEPNLEVESADDKIKSHDSRTSSSEKETYQLARDREMRVIRMPKRFGIADLISYALTVAEEVIGEELSSYKQAMNSRDKSNWLSIMKKEMASLKKNDTWILVEKPMERKLVECKWIFKLKEGVAGVEPPRYKVRLVAKGFTQREGVDYSEVFSPVAKYSSIKVLLAITAYFDLELDKLDVKTAFLHGNLEEEIYMEQPKGFIQNGLEDRVCLLKKSLYGLKQSPRQGYLKFDQFMMAHGYFRSQYNNCVYCKLLPSRNGIYLLFYIDDILIACKHREKIEKLKSELRSEFEMKDLGSESSDDADIEYMKKVSYSSVVGSIMYAMVCTRPNIAYSVGLVSRFMGNPGKSHWDAAKWTLRYLKGTSESNILFGGDEGVTSKIIGYVDSDFAGDLDKRRSTTGFVFTLCGGVVSWKASLEPVVALSTIEAEYIALVEAVKEAKWLSGIVSELGLNQDTIPVCCNSSSAIQLSKNSKCHERTKHVDIRLHFIREEIERGAIDVVRISTEDNPADALTKPLPTIKFRNSLSLIGVRCFSIKASSPRGFFSRGVLGESDRLVEKNKPDIEQLLFWCQYWGRLMLYNVLLRPYAAKHEKEIDLNLLKLRIKAREIGLLLWEKAAIYGQTRFFEILQYVSSHSASLPQSDQQQEATEEAINGRSYSKNFLVIFANKI
ncbi:Integrase catalytic domain-containing protein [Citrus sinensis]|nr:Integrase catalytic domain-containing protein [Citrus sinensis]